MTENKRRGFQPESEMQLTPNEQESLRQSFAAYLSDLRIPGIEKLEGSLTMVNADSSDRRRIVTNVVLQFSCQKPMGKLTLNSEARLGYSYYVPDRAKARRLVNGLQSAPECIAVYKAGHQFFLANQIQLQGIPVTQLLLAEASVDEPNPEITGQTTREVVGFSVNMRGVPHQKL